MELRSVEELEKMISWLEIKIKAYELKMEEAGWGTRMNTSQCEDSRREYAGWLAERALLERILKTKTKETNLLQGFKN